MKFIKGNMLNYIKTNADKFKTAFITDNKELDNILSGFADTRDKLISYLERNNKLVLENDNKIKELAEENKKLKNSYTRAEGAVKNIEKILGVN